MWNSSVAASRSPPAVDERSNPASSDIARTVLIVLVIGILIAGSVWTLVPFIGSLIWATALVVATWPLLLWVQRHVGGSRAAATAVMTALITVAFIVPFWLVIGAILDASANAIAIVRSYMTQGLGPPPEWLGNIPGIGARVVAKWNELAGAGPDALGEALRPYMRTAAASMVEITGGVGGLIVHFLLTVILVAVLYTTGETAARGVVAFARRLGQERGVAAVILAGQSVRSVALGVVVTALVQSTLAGLGLWVCGVPHPGLLTALIFVLCIAQLGPSPVLIPAVVWMYGNGSFLWATALLIWSIPVGIMDNLVRPILIGRGVDLPLLLIVGGVIGGLIGFGAIGLFAGPVILAVTYTVLQGWVRDSAMQPEG